MPTKENEEQFARLLREYKSLPQEDQEKIKDFVEDVKRRHKELLEKEREDEITKKRCLRSIFAERLLRYGNPGTSIPDCLLCGGYRLGCELYEPRGGAE